MVVGMAEQNPPELVTTTQAAELLGLDRSTVNRWVAKGLVQPFADTRAGRLYDAELIRQLAAAMPPKERTPTA
jgi:excisionase family DNA binding protein